MPIVHLQTGAKRIQPLLPRPRVGKTMLRAFAIAKMNPFATAALGRKGISLVNSESQRRRRARHVQQRRHYYIAKTIFRIDEMVTDIDIPIMLDDQISSASLAE